MASATDSIASIVQMLDTRDNFVVVAHPRMDGDAIGSVLALTHSLRAAGKNIQPVSQGLYPGLLKFLPGTESIIEWKGPEAWPNEWKPEVVLVCDIGGVNRVHEFLASVEKFFPVAAEGQPRMPGLNRPFVVNIDHHVSNNGFGDVAWIDPSACSTGEMVLEILRAANLPIPQATAINLYAAILSDTGSFNFSNTTPRAMHMAADLIDAGANPSEISRAIYRTKTLSLLKLEGLTVQRIQTAADGRLAWSYLLPADFEAVGLTLYDAPDLVNLVTELDTARVAVLFLELPDRPPITTKISLRGEGYHNLSEIAARWNGGGHPRASGATIYKPIKRVMEMVIAELTPLCEADTPQQF